MLKAEFARLACAVFALTLVAGCSIKRMAADTTAELLVDASKTFKEEPDIQIAAAALPANLKLMEGLLKVTPKNRAISTMLSEGWCSYGFGFVEDSGVKGDLERASTLYQRGYEYGARALPEEVESALKKGDLEEIEQALAKLETPDVAPLFWTAYCLGNWMNLNTDKVSGVGELSKVELMMRRVTALDESYFHGGADLFYAVYYGKRPKLLGGNPEKAKEYLLKADAFSQGRFLPVKLFRAEVYAVAIQDQKLFEDTLKEILAAPADLMPEERLANELTKRRASKLLERKDELF